MDRPAFAIEATNLTDARSTGVGRYTRQLVEALSLLEVPPEQEFDLLQLCKRSRWKLRAGLARGHVAAREDAHRAAAAEMNSGQVSWTSQLHAW